MSWIGHEYPESFLTAFRAVVEPGAVGECWLWPHRIGENGYGVFSHDGRQSTTHRTSYAAFVDDPGEAVVRHRCDVRACWNPACLLLGTPGDNMRDAVERDRVAWGDRRALKLTRDQARSIFIAYHSGTSISKLSRCYCLSTATVHNIARRRLWRRDTADLVAPSAPASRHLSGEQHPRTKTTAAMAAEIRRRVAAGEPRSRMVVEFELSKSQVQRIVTGGS